jgi:hypothetical protein
MKHWITVVGGETINASSYNNTLTSLGVAGWAFDARSLGFTWQEVLQRMAFEARSNVIPIETSTGREWTIRTADADYGYNAVTAANAITQTHDMTDNGRAVDDLASHFKFQYAFDASLPGGGNEEGFKLALIANPSTSTLSVTADDITTASERFGAIESGPIAFRCIQHPGTAMDVAGFIVQERMANDRSVFELRGVAWFDALRFDVGDIVHITPPWASAATDTCRITSMSKEFLSNTWTITAVEVMDVGLG